MNNFDIKKYNKAFTLIELLVIMAIIGLLTSIILVSLKSIRAKAKIAAGMQFSGSIYHVLGDNMLGEWKFEDNLEDTSGNNNHGEYYPSSSAPSFAESFMGSAEKSLSLDGSGYVIVPYSDSMEAISLWDNDVTISLWIKPAVLPSSFYSFIFINQGQSFLSLLNNGALDWQIRTSSSELKSGMTENKRIAPGNWYHIALTTGDSGKLKIFINGAEQKLSYNYWLSTYLGSSEPIYIGGYPSFFSEGKFNGLIDEVRIYKGKFNIGQVQQIYAEGLKKI